MLGFINTSCSYFEGWEEAYTPAGDKIVPISSVTVKEPGHHASQHSPVLYFQNFEAHPLTATSSSSSFFNTFYLSKISQSFNLISFPTSSYSRFYLDRERGHVHWEIKLPSNNSCFGCILYISRGMHELPQTQSVMRSEGQGDKHFIWAYAVRFGHGL